jgi:hypothetical protein
MTGTSRGDFQEGRRGRQGLEIDQGAEQSRAECLVDRVGRDMLIFINLH